MTVCFRDMEVNHKVVCSLKSIKPNILEYKKIIISRFIKTLYLYAHYTA